MCCYKVCTRDLYNVFTRDLYRRLIQGTSTKCLQHFHKAFQQCVYNTSTGVFLQCSPKAFIHFAKSARNLHKCFLQVVYKICTSVFERLLQHLYM